MKWLELLESWGKDVLAGQDLPITVTAAILLFMVKEGLEIRRKRQERLRKNPLFERTSREKPREAA